MKKMDKQITGFTLAEEISRGNEKAYEQLFFKHYYPLCRFAVKITGCSEMARDAVQEVFVNVWKNRESLDIEHSLKAYLYQSVRNRALNMAEQRSARHQMRDRLRVEADLQEEELFNVRYSYNIYRQHLSRVVRQIWILVEQMPEQRKLVFELHRKHGLSYQEISSVMGISRKTVENHMGKALHELRENLDVDRYFNDVGSYIKKI